MVAKRAFLSNYKEHEENQRLGLKEDPPIETAYVNWYFKLEGITSMYVTIDNHIQIMYLGQSILLKNEKTVYTKIKTYLE